MRIALIDDDKEFIQFEKGIVEEQLLNYINDFSIDLFLDGEKFLQTSASTLFDLVFLDIDLVEIGGFKVADLIRKNENRTEIVFVSNHEHFVFNSLEYQPFQFVRKQFACEELKKTLELYFNNCYKKNKCTSVISDGKECKIKLDSIVYFESHRHKLVAYTLNKEYSYRYKISDKENELQNFDFVRVHNGYLVNLKYVVSVGKNVLQVSHGNTITTIPVSRSRMNAVKTAFHRCLRCQVQ